MEQNERENLEAELRVLHSTLDASSSDVGDWNMSKAVEELIVALTSAENTSVNDVIKEWAEYQINGLKKKIAERIEIRNRINEIQEELNE